MHDIYFILLVFFVALIVASLTHQPVLYFAKKNNIFDNPDVRKLQREPVPVMGGLVVFFGAMAGSLCYWFKYNCLSIVPVQLAMLVMLIIGVWDDMKNLSPNLRLILEILIVTVLALCNCYPINDLHGLWGVHGISPWIAWPLTIFGCVGIINAINMIDGIDGLSSGICIMAFGFYSWMFFTAHDFVRAALGVSIIGGLIPFFVMNVFGKRSKMFIGDAGTMMLGVALCDMVMAMLTKNSLCGIKRDDGTLIQSSSTPVEVKYSDCDATNYNNPPVKDLLGRIAVFKDDFSIGQYSLDVTGAETIEIYYKPNVEVAAYLTDESGQSVSDLSNLAAGNYTISFGFVKAGTKEKVADSKLLGDVSYSALVTNNGKTHEKLYSDGDKIALEEGSLTIDVTARYLDYNSVSTNLSYDIYKDKTITFTVVDSPSYVVTSDGFEKDARIKVVSQIDGKDFTEEQWSSLEAPILQMVDEKRDFKIELSTLEKSDEVGVFYFNPKLPNGKPSTGTYQDIQYTLDYRQQFGSETWSGSTEGLVKLSDSRSWWERNWDLFVKLVILAAILFVLIGYLPFIKHYLPKSLKKKPYIKCIPSEPGEKRKDRNGVINKNLVSTLIPYIPQTGTIKYVPKGVTGCPAMAVRAIKHRRMTLTNVKAFAGKDYITFDGEAIKKDVKKFETGAGVSIRVKRGEWTYICSPNQSN